MREDSTGQLEGCGGLIGPNGKRADGSAGEEFGGNSREAQMKRQLIVALESRLHGAVDQTFDSVLGASQAPLDIPHNHGHGSVIVGPSIITATLDFQTRGDDGLDAERQDEGEGGIGCVFMPDFKGGAMRLVTVSAHGPASKQDLQVGDVLLEVGWGSVGALVLACWTNAPIRTKKRNNREDMSLLQN